MRDVVCIPTCILQAELKSFTDFFLDMKSSGLGACEVLEVILQGQPKGIIEKVTSLWYTVLNLDSRASMCYAHAVRSRLLFV